MNDIAVRTAAELKIVANDVERTFAGLSEERLNWKPAENSWSIAQCLDHLILTDKAFFPDLDAIGNGTRRNGFWENWSPLTGYFGRFLISSMRNDEKKVKSPSKTIVPPSEIEPGIIGRYLKHVDILIEKINAAGRAVDAERTIFTSPFARIITYSFADGCTVIAEHAKRHTRQAKRVMEAENFPA